MMHDCRQTKALLTDLALGEPTTEAHERALAEMSDCAACRAEHEALTALARTCDRARVAAQPAEDFWPGFSARLAARLQTVDTEAPDARHALSARTPSAALLSSAFSTLRRAFAINLRVPAPVAAVALLAFVALSIFALRPAPTEIVLAAPPEVGSPAPARIVEVPVVQEKIVTRTVYIAAKEQSALKRAQPQTDNRELAQQTEAGRAAARLALAGFQPAADVKLRVIKGGYKHEQ